MKQLETKRYILRKPTENDAEIIYEKWGTDKENIAQYKEHKFYRNIIETKALIKSLIKESEDEILFWIIEEKETKNPVQENYTGKRRFVQISVVTTRKIPERFHGPGSGAVIMLRSAHQLDNPTLSEVS